MPNLKDESSNKKQKLGLGRGLGSLLGQAGSPQSHPQHHIEVDLKKHKDQPREEKIPTDARIWKIGIDKLKSSEFQPRSYFEKDKLEELAASIRENGILQPIIARKSISGSFEIVAGERRWRAAQIAGLHEVPVIIKEFADQKALELAIIENVQREDLSPIEEGEAYQRLASEFNLTQVQIAEKVGKDRATVANAMRILNLPLRVKDLIATSKISLGHAKVLLALTQPVRQIELGEQVAKQNLSVRKLERIVADEVAGRPHGPTLHSHKEDLAKKLVSNISDEIQKLMGTKVNIDYQDGKGKLSIHFYSDDELSSIVEKLRSACQK